MSVIVQEAECAVTRIPNAVIDRYLPQLSGGALACWIYLCRGVEADAMELSVATGYVPASIEVYTDELQRRRLIECRVTLPGDRVIYWLRTDEE